MTDSRSGSQPVWPPAVAAPLADVGVFGGSGFYEFLLDAREVAVSTPYGPPSAPVVIGTIGDRRVAFLARHGRAHTIPAHRVDYRANLWALHSLGVRAVVSPFSCGSLRAELAPGHFVIVDDLVDRTAGRAATYFDGAGAFTGSGTDPTGGVVNHVTFARPYDESLRTLARDACRAHAADTGDGLVVHDGGTVVVVHGPRFSTRAESRWFAAMGWSVVNMTQHPEAVLAAELGLPFVGIALVTDYDAGLEGAEGVHARPVTMEAVFAVLRENVARVRAVITRLVPTIPL